MPPENKPNPGHPVSPAPTQPADSSLTAVQIYFLASLIWRFLRNRGFGDLVSEIGADRVLYEAFRREQANDSRCPICDWNAWVYGCALAAARQLSASSSHLRQCDPCVLEMASAPEPDSESHEEVGAAFDALPDEERKVLDLTVVHELSFAEAGRRMKLKAYTVRRRHESGLRRLRLLLEGQYTGRK